MIHSIRLRKKKEQMHEEGRQDEGKKMRPKGGGGELHLARIDGNKVAVFPTPASSCGSLAA